MWLVRTDWFTNSWGPVVILNLDMSVSLCFALSIDYKCCISRSPPMVWVLSWNELTAEVVISWPPEFARRRL